MRHDLSSIHPKYSLSDPVANPKPPYLLFLGEARESADIKTAGGIHYWRPELCAGQLRLPGARLKLPLPEMSPARAASSGVRSLLIGTVTAGGIFPQSWRGIFLEALRCGLDIVNGLHQRLDFDPELASAARENGCRLIELRDPGRSFDIGRGEPRSGKRILTVGTDCNVGKMYTALAVERELKERNKHAAFRATGQTGILIAGGGVPLDAVVSDFVSGATEYLSPAAPDNHWDVIEGQGSLHHPAYAGVTLGLIHGAQPDWLIVCHDPMRADMRHAPGYPVPDLGVATSSALDAARLTNPEVRCAGFSLNTSRLGEDEAAELLTAVSEAFGLPAVDPVRTSIAPLVDRILY